MKKIGVVHFNTPFMLTCLIKSINKHVKNAYIYVFDNSNKEPFINTFNNVEVIDNTKNQIINFYQLSINYKIENTGSWRHSVTIQKLIEIIDDNFVLLDSDVLIKKDFSFLYEKREIHAGCFEPIFKRIAPYMCFINVNECKKHNIQYYKIKTGENVNNKTSDTGSQFYASIIDKNIPCDKNVSIGKYIKHLDGGSWRNKDINEFIFNNKHLWDDTERIIVTLTSHPKRINNIIPTLKSIINQNTLPYKIVLNLSVEEFPNKELSLPLVLQEFLKVNNLIEVQWLKHNTIVWKKTIPTLLKYTTDCVICVDDDFIYEKDFITLFYTKYKESKCPISGSRMKFFNNNIQHCGQYSLDSYMYMKDTLNLITQEIYEKQSPDTFFTYCYEQAQCQMDFVGIKIWGNVKEIQQNETDKGFSKENNVNIYKAWDACCNSPKNEIIGKKIIQYICETI